MGQYLGLIHLKRATETLGDENKGKKIKGVTYPFLDGSCQPPSIQVAEELPTILFNSMISELSTLVSTIFSKATPEIKMLCF
jgi:hypothetical protein